MREKIRERTSRKQNMEASALINLVIASHVNDLNI
jgi:hypothetical protein